MQTTVKILCFALVAFGVMSCAKTDNQSNPQSFVEIVGTAEREVDPDVFYLSFTLNNEIAKNRNIDIGTLEQRMLRALQEIGVDIENDLTVTGMSGNNWNWWRRSSTTYQFKTYQLKAGNLELMNKVCDVLDSQNITYFLSRTDYADIEELQKEIQREAVQNARLKAENLLMGENRQVNELIYLQEQQVFSSRPMFAREMAFADASFEASPSPSFNKMKVSYSVIARFSIK